ncbi:hypothetical protein RchiOBHm_Chr5g0018541 [Rosa chinensis]|uniref:Uncharacterized protein n=1 Tax=Rosa chinensis TaxID=74649 RepID=A0A2P6Q6T7_ROSCH|nr:hypothetical protein RchiOBHm_Chr5g0018541 [Rosa chinensis]
MFKGMQKLSFQIFRGRRLTQIQEQRGDFFFFLLFFFENTGTSLLCHHDF